MSELIEDGKVVSKVRESLERQHAIHGVFGRVWDRLGGEEFLYEWAEENPGRFITLITKMTPGLAPTSGFQGKVVLHVDASLTPTALDHQDD